MDEVWFHISRQLEIMQLYLNSGLQTSRDSIIQWSSNINQIWNNSLSERLQNFAVTALDSARNVYRQCSIVFAQPTEVYYQLSEFVRIERRIDVTSTYLSGSQLVFRGPLGVRELYQKGPQDAIKMKNYRLFVPIIYPGSAGFITGAVIGVFIGLSLPRPVKPVHRMKAVVCLSYDGLDALTLIEDAISPTITQPNQIIVQVKAASVDIIDIKICSGYGKTLRNLHHTSNTKSLFPLTLGRDCSGIVVDIGQRVTKCEVGDAVVVVSPFWNDGLLSEFILTTEDMICVKPKNIGFEGAASLPYSACLAYYACLRADVIDSKRNKRVLIQSGVSPVGCLTCQIAKHYGCQVTVTCSARAVPVARALGASQVVVFGQLDMEKQLAKEKFDVVINTMGGVDYELSQSLCKEDGVVVTTVPEPYHVDYFTLPSSFVYSLYLRFKYFVKKLNGSKNQWSEVTFSSSVFEKVCELVERGIVQPVVDRVLAPQDIMLALQHCDSVDAIGKTVIKFRYRTDFECGS